MTGQIVISGSEHDLIDVMARAKIIENLLKERKFRYERVFMYDGCQEIEYKERRIYNIAGEFIQYTIHAPVSQVNFIWHLYCEIYTQMMNIALNLQKSTSAQEPVADKPKRCRKKKST